MMAATQPWLLTVIPVVLTELLRLWPAEPNIDLYKLTNYELLWQSSKQVRKIPTPTAREKIADQTSNQPLQVVTPMFGYAAAPANSASPKHPMEKYLTAGFKITMYIDDLVISCQK